MKHSSFILLILSMTMVSCNNNEGSEMTTISGVIHSADSEKVYLARIDHFDYMNNGYIIDSSAVSKDGRFEFSPHDLSSNLVTITTANFQPYTLQILNNDPQTYYFGNCEKFFTSNPTFYVENNENIDFEWFQHFSIDSIGNLDNSKSAARQIKMRDIYLNAKKRDLSNVDFDWKVDIQENWEQLLIERDFDIRAADLKQIGSVNSFDNFVYTEIYLGSLNRFLWWMEKLYPKEVEFAVQNPEKETGYSRAISAYKNHDWNPKNFEYFKSTERYVNFYMSIETGTFKIYHEPSEKKREIAERVLSGDNKERYLLLMDEQLKHVL